ncbi:MAG: outer membrane beta-barrel family protein [Bacteroidales bacterium]|nr:outer membrane beta-barrel family protein [Bacteroidales bacterium]
MNLQGRVMNTEGEALSNINILVYNPGSKVLVAFAVSDDQGHFQTSVNSTSDSLDIEVSSIQYRKEYRSIANTSQNLQFELLPDVKQLKGITIKASPIEQRGDTISYLVSSFAVKEDRAIEDVLRRMPGIEVEPNGRILYQGVPLQKFYVEGLDLMDGRYGVVSKNLPQSSVSVVEILENHQPIRILEERTTSYQPSLNLKLKHDITTTGTAKLGTGVKPFLWDVNITPMIFTKNFQVLASYQTNNTGNDVSQQLKVLTLEDLLKNVDRPAENPGMLQIIDVNPPEISMNRYLDNNINLLNFNGLQRISRDFQLRANLYYINDIQGEQAALQRTLYTPSDTLTFTEDFNNRLHDNYLNSEFTLTRNVKNNYLNNELKIQSRWDKQTGVINTGSEDIVQSLKDPFKAISNELRTVNPVGKYLVEFWSFITYDHSPHSLAVSPGQFEENLNYGESYKKVLQQMDLKHFYADHSASLVLSWKRLNINPRLGIAYRRQMLESNIFITQQEEEREAGPSFINKLDGRHTRAYLQTEVEYRKSGLTLKARLPLSWQQIYMDDLTSEGEQKLSRLLFDPHLSVDYRINGFWRVRGSWSYANRLGDIDRVNFGFILRNYRDLSQNAAPLSETSSNNFSLNLSYRNPITSFFNSFSYIYVFSHNNLIYGNKVQSDGTTIIQAVELPNTSYSHNLQAYTSKYFAVTKTTISFHANYNQRRGKSLMNGELFIATSILFNFKPELNIRITKWLNAEYGLNASYIQTFIENEKKGNISILRNNFNVFAFPTKSQLISISSEYYKCQGDNNLFVDFLYRYTITKRKIDVEFRWNNIFNSKTYTTYQANAFIVWESSYFLRPSQVFLSVKFSF